MQRGEVNGYGHAMADARRNDGTGLERAAGRRSDGVFMKCPFFLTQRVKSLINQNMCRNSIISRVVLLAAVLSMPLSAVEVEAEGRAAGDAPAARQQALTDALREAVRSGAGVDLVSESQIENFELQFDRTFSKARGYVKKYEVLSAGLTDDGFYTVRIKADVGDTPPPANDTMTFQMMAREHEAPRIAIQIDEQIEGVQNGTLATDWLRNTAMSCGLRVVDLNNAQGQGGMLAKRAETLGRKTEAALRKDGVVSACDYIIEGNIVGSSAGTQSFYGSKAGKKYSLGLNITIRDAATGAIVLTENPASRDILIRNVASDTAAAREAVRQLLEGSKRVADSDSGWKLIRRIFAHWAAEMDLGATIKLEFVGLDLESANKLKAGLEQQTAVGAVWIRSIDAVAVSVLECESRLNSTDLAKVISQLLPEYGLDRSEKRYLSFRKGEGSREFDASSGDLSLWIIISGIVVIIGAVSVLVFGIIRKKTVAQ